MGAILLGIKASASVTVSQVTDGTDGNGIKSTVVEYQAGSSGTTAPTGSWSTSIPATTASAPYLWTKVTYTYTDGSDPKVVYSVGSTPEGAIESSKAYTDAQIEILDGKIISTASEVTSLGTRMSTVEQSAEKIDFLITTETGTTNFTLTDAGATLLSENLTITDGNGSTVITGGKLTIGFRDNLVKDVTEGSLTVLDDKLEVLTSDTVSITVDGEELYANNIISLIFANSSGGDGWVYYFNKRVTIPRFEVNLSLAAFGDITGFIVHRTNSLNYVVWYENDTWHGQLADGTGGSSEWSWNSSTDIVLAEWTKKTAESISYQVYSPARSYEEIRTKAMLGNWASGAISENTMIDGGLLKTHTVVAEKLATDAIKSSNYVYSSGKFSNSGTFLDLTLGTIKSKNFSIDENGSVGVIGDITANSLNVKQYITITNPTTGQSGKVISYEGSGSNQLSLGGTQASRIASLVSIWGPVSIGGDGNNSVLSCAKVNTEQISNVYTINSGEGTISVNGGMNVSGAVNFANATWNRMGDDCYIGDCNIAGAIGIQGINGATGLYYADHGGGWYMSDDEWMRTYNNKSVYSGTGMIFSSGVVRADGGFNMNSQTLHNRLSSDLYFSRNWRCTEGGNLNPYGSVNGNINENSKNAVNIGNTGSYIKNLYYGGSLSKQSDRRIKNPIGELTEDEMLTILSGSKIQKFTYKSDKLQGVNYGVYAQDLRDLLISSGIGHISMLGIDLKDSDGEQTKDLTTPEENVQYTVDYSQYAPLLVKGWQYHDRKIVDMETRANEDESRIEGLTFQLEEAFSKIIELKNKLEKLEKKLESVA